MRVCPGTQLNGTFVGFEDLTTQLDVCSNLPLGTKGNAPDYFKIGHGTTKVSTADLVHSTAQLPCALIDVLAGGGTRQECDGIDISYLLSEATSGPQRFYDLFLVDADGTLVPTATKLLNYRNNGDLVNLDTDVVEDQANKSLIHPAVAWAMQMACRSQQATNRRSLHSLDGGDVARGLISRSW